MFNGYTPSHRQAAFNAVQNGMRAGFRAQGVRDAQYAFQR